MKVFRDGLLRTRHDRYRIPAVTRPMFVACVMFGLGSSANAQQSDGGTLEPMVVTASRVAQALADTLPDTTLITRADIEQSEATDVLSLLRRQAGVEIAQSGGLGAQASVFMRGTNSNQTLVLIDGVRVNALQSGAAILGHLMLDEVDHIEIVRGNVSALYGSQAVGGVIQIFTRSGQGVPELSLDAQAGSERNGNLSFYGGGSVGPEDARTRASIAVSDHTVNGFSAIDANLAPQANPNRNGYDNTSVSAAVAQQLGKDEVGLRLYDSRARLSFDDPTDYGFLVPDYNGRNQTNEERSEHRTTSLYVHLQIAPTWTSELQLGIQRDESTDVSSFALSPLIGSTDSRVNQLTWSNVLELTTTQKLTAGLEHIDEVGMSSSYPSAFTRSVNSAQAGYLGAFGSHQLQLNLRSDRYSDFGDANSALAAYGYRLTPRLKATAQLSTAFDAPSFDDLFFPGASNPDLKPETSRSAELGLDYLEGDDGLRVSIYRTLVRDLIQFDPVTFIPENVDRARLSGIEVSGHSVWQGWRIHGNLTLQRPIDGATDQLLLRRATRNVNLGIARAVGRWDFSADVESAGPRDDVDINTFARIALPGYSVTDFVARYALDPHTILSISLLNAFDRRYFLVDGFNTPGRVLLFAVHWRS